MSGAPDSPFPTTDRYEPIATLGSGAFGRVWEVFDRVHRRRVALKQLLRMAPEEVQRFRAEFRAISEFVHPNVVSLYELESDGQTAFFTMELVRGRHLLAHLGVRGSTVDYARTWTPTPTLDGSAFAATPEPAPEVEPARDPVGGRADPAAVRDPFRQLAEGIAAIHDAGMVHRDVKPSNVLVTPAGRAVLLDFGLAVPVDLAGERIAGTPGYMSPEQAEGDEVGPASDWYAFGAALYEALAGRLPFEGSRSELLRAQRYEDPPALAALAPDAPADLVALVGGLLARDPRARPDAVQVLRALGGRRPIPWRRAGFVGRAAELAALAAAWASVKPGRPVVAGISGAPGVGKSALARAFLSRATGAPRVLAGRCWERESVPYKALDDLVRQLPRDAIDADLARLFPSLGAAVLTSGLDARELRRRAAAALRSRLAALAAERPLIVAIDDVQWGDADSTEIIEAVLAPPDAPAVLVLFTCRAEGRGAPLPRALLGLQGVEAIDLRLDPLGDDEVRTMVARLVGDSELATRIAAESGGMPFEVEVLAQDGSSRGDVGELLDGLHDGDLALLGAISVAGQPVERDLVRAVAAIEDDAAGLARLRLRRLVHATGTPGNETLEPRHDRVREAVTAHLGDPAAVHRAWAAVLTERDADPEWRMVHHRAAGERDRAAACAVVAADRAMDALAFHHASELYAEALALGGGPELHRRQAEALVACGRAPEAADAWLRAADHAPEAAIDLRRRAAEQLLLAGHADRGKEVAALVLAPLGMGLARWSYSAFASMLWTRARLQRADYAFTPRAAPDPDVLLRLDTCWSLASAMSLVDTARASEFQARQSVLALSAGDPVRAARALGLEAAYVAIVGPSARAACDRLTDKARALAVPTGNPEALAHAALFEGIVRYLVGDYADAIGMLGEVEPTLRRSPNANWELSAAVSMTMDARMRQGAWADLAATLPAEAASARHTGNRYVHGFTEFVRATSLLLAEDRPVEAIGAIRAFYPRPALAEPTIQDWWGHHGAVPAMMYQGAFDEALARLDAHGQAIQLAGLPMIALLGTTMHHTRGIACVGAVRGRSGLRRRWLLGRARWYALRLRLQGVPWGPGYAAWVRGCTALADGDTDGAIRAFDQAVPILRETDHRVHAALVLRRRGLLAGGDGGAAQVADADAILAAQGVRRPDRLTDALVPDAR